MGGGLLKCRAAEGREFPVINHVVENYENYKEEDRLTTNNAGKIEFVNTIKVLNEHIRQKSKILDCAAGTGIYAFHFAGQGHQVTATDITPRHIALIKQKMAAAGSSKKGQSDSEHLMSTAVLDATDMSIFADETFDVVLNMGPYYHLVKEEQREKCISECIRVLKRGGLLVTAYIPRFYVFQHAALSDPKYLDGALARQIIETGELRHDDEKCFWTDTYYASKEEMEKVYLQYDLKIVDHFAQDGMAPLLSQTVDKWSEEEFEIWCSYHYSVCREQSILGASNHVIIIGEK